MSHRIREAMRDNGFNVFGEHGGIVEIDETFIGRNKTKKPGIDDFTRAENLLQGVKGKRLTCQSTY